MKFFLPKTALNKNISANQNHFFWLSTFLAFYFLTRIYFFIIAGDWAWEDDAYEHFYQSRLLINRWDWAIAFQYWNKFLFTGVSALLIKIWDSMWIIKFMNVALWLGVALLVYKYMFCFTHKGFIAFTSAFWTVFDYIGFRASVSALTEPMGAFFVTCGIVFHRSFFGFLPLIRPECIVLAVPFFIQKPNRRLFYDISLAALPNLIVMVVSFLTLNDAFFPFRSPHPIHTGGIYGIGDWNHYIKLFAFYNPATFLILLLGLLSIFHSYRTGEGNNNSTFHMIRCLSAVFIFFVFHSLLYANDLMGTAGLARYFTTLIPIISIIFGFSLYHFIYVRNYSFFRYIAIGLLCLVSLWSFRVFFHNGIHFNAFHFPQKDPQLKAFAERSAHFVEVNLEKNYLSASKPAIRYYSKLPPANLKWPNPGQFDDPHCYMALEPFLKHYSGIDLDHAKKQGEIVLRMGPYSLMNCKQ